MQSAAIDLDSKLRARRSLPPVAMRQPLREAAGASRQDVADEVARLLTEEAGSPATCTAQAVRYWELGRSEPRGRYLLAYTQVLDTLRQVAS